MGKKAKLRRKDAYKKFLEGMVNYRNSFIEKKIGLITKILSNDELKNTIMSKNRSEMNILERAAVDTINERELSTIESFEAISETLKENQIKSAKFKYTAKKI